MTYQPVHRLTPLLRFWTLLLALIAIVAVNLNFQTVQSAFSLLSITRVLYAVAIFIAVCAAVWALSYIWWKATGYRLGDEEIALRRGVFNKKLRTARYDRIQAVDVVEDLIARVFRVAAVRVETAGGAGSVIEIAYLKRDTANALRAEILRRTGGVEAPSDVLVPVIPIARSLVGAALRTYSVAAAGFMVFFLLTPVSAAVLIPVLIGVVPPVWRQIDSSWKFTARVEDTTVHLSYGLADRRQQSIPLHRIHGVRVSQPILWRIFGWWQVDVSVAGYGTESNSATGTSRVLPVGSREQALAVLHAVSEVRDLDGAPGFTSPARAWLVSPVDLAQQSVTLSGAFAICHKGRLARSVSVIDTSHIQELTLRRGPLQQMLRLCTVRFDLVAGPVRMAGQDLDVEEGRRLLDQLRSRELPQIYRPSGNPS